MDGNITKHRKRMIRDLIMKKSFNNNIQKLKKDFLKINEKALKKKKDKNSNNLIYLKTSTNCHKTNIKINKNISTKIKHQKGKEIKLFTPENNFFKNKFKNRNKNNIVHNKVRSTKNSQIKISKTTNISNYNYESYINFTESPINKKYRQKKILNSSVEKVENKKIPIDKNQNDIDKYESPFDLNFIFFNKEEVQIKTFIEKDLKKKKIKFNKIDSEKNINYKCFKNSGLRFNIDINKLRKEKNIEQSNIFICKIKNVSINDKYDFLNFVNSFYRVYI